MWANDFKELKVFKDLKTANNQKRDAAYQLSRIPFYFLSLFKLFYLPDFNIAELS